MVVSFSAGHSGALRSSLAMAETKTRAEGCVGGVQHAGWERRRGRERRRDLAPCLRRHAVISKSLHMGPGLANRLLFGTIRGELGAGGARWVR